MNNKRVVEGSVAVGLGTLFGLGLAISQMVNPARVLGFLDFTGDWDPSLAFVMGGALMVATPAFLWSRRRDKAILGSTLSLPTKTEIETRLVVGATLFGVGWGLVGLCPGPAVASLALAASKTLPFVLAMVAGALLHDRIWTRLTRSI